ncbi:MAG: RimK/LysX family protein [Bacteriovoracaceae bacterium]
MKFFLGLTWVLSSFLFFFVGRHSVETVASGRVPASAKPKVIGQSVSVGLGDSQDLQYRAKVDTGAESSSLHAFDIKVHDVKEGKRIVPYVRYKTIDDQGRVHQFNKRVSRIDDVKNSNGTTIRYYVKERVWLHGVAYDIEMNLTNRKDMTFKFLLGKNMLRMGELFVDPNKDVIIYEENVPRYVYRE